jgi:hypothetical protein
MCNRCARVVEARLALPALPLWMPHRDDAPDDPFRAWDLRSCIVLALEVPPARSIATLIPWRLPVVIDLASPCQHGADGPGAVTSDTVALDGGWAALNFTNSR